MLRLRPALRPVSLLSRRTLFTSSLRFQQAGSPSPPSVTSETKIPVAEDPRPEVEAQDEIPTSYPEVKRELYYHRDPYAGWDDKQNRRNFNEPLHQDDDILNLWSPEYYDTVSDGTAVRWVSYFFLSIAGLFGVCYTFFYPERRAVPRNYPHDGLSRALGARTPEEAEYLGARVDKTAY